LGFNSTTDLLGRLNLTVSPGAGATLQTENALIPLSANLQQQIITLLIITLFLPHGLS